MAVTEYAWSAGICGSTRTVYSTVWPGNTVLVSMLDWSPPWEDSAMTCLWIGGTVTQIFGVLVSTVLPPTVWPPLLSRSSPFGSAHVLSSSPSALP